MNLQEVYIVQPTTEQAVNIKAILKALKVKFDVAKVENPYNAAFVEKIKKSKQQYKQGKYTIINKKNIGSFLYSI